MPSLQLSHLLQHFYKFSVPCLPVIDGEEGLLGFVLRRDIDRLGADLERLQEEHSRIPEWLLTFDVAEEMLSDLVEKSPVPVLDLTGRETGRWNRPELYRRIAELEDHRRSRTAVEPIQPEPARREDEGDWLSRLILASIPHPLLATDLNGRTLFFNENFIKRILERGPFKNTLALAETYFLEVNRSALARTFSAGPHPVDLLFVSLPDLHLTLEIVSLEHDRVIMGYLYLFHDPEVTGLPDEITTRLESGMDLDSIMEDMEAGIIASMLRRTGQNVSHAAKALGVNRSTLQNKIRRLDLGTRFHRRVDGPVRRIRRSRDLIGDEASAQRPDREDLRKFMEGAPPAGATEGEAPLEKEASRHGPGRKSDAPGKSIEPKKGKLSAPAKNRADSQAPVKRKAGKKGKP